MTLAIRLTIIALLVADASYYLTLGLQTYATIQAALAWLIWEGRAN